MRASKTRRANAGTTAPGTYTAPRATAACATAPNSPECQSCGFDTAKSDAACATNNGYYAEDDDSMNVRFFHMKQRFGVDPQYPLSRYVAGFRSPVIPDRASEHDASGRYVGTGKCTNPLFAAKLYASDADARADGADLCNLPRGTRGKDLVYFAVVGGVPNTLLYDDASTMAPRRKASLDWPKILGRDPVAYDYAGQDPHMQQSTTARSGLPDATPPRGINGTDAVNGREWNTQGKDLQYACTFPLGSTHPSTTGAAGSDAPNSDGKAGYYCGPRTNSSPARIADIQVVPVDLCDCDTLNDNPPLCDNDDKTRQIRAKAPRCVSSRS